MINNRTSSPVASDDTSVLRVLLHAIQGSSPVSTTEFVRVKDNAE